MLSLRVSMAWSGQDPWAPEILCCISEELCSPQFIHRRGKGPASQV